MANHYEIPSCSKCGRREKKPQEETSGSFKNSYCNTIDVQNEKNTIDRQAGKPPTGLHLDVLKGDKLIQKLMLDEKKCYLFGRNPQMNDFCIDHQSCSRVHAAFVYHKHLNRAFLVDLGSTHGTYIGKMRLESNKPTQLPIDSNFHFGASTRNYIIRERPTNNSMGIMEELPNTETEGALLGLPESQTELDNLTEFNTAHNRRISMLGISTDDTSDIKTAGTKRGASSMGPPSKKQKRHISFNEEVDIINPEDIDPTVGKFRNLVHSTIIPNTHTNPRKMRLQQSDDTSGHHVHSQKLREGGSLYEDIPAPTTAHISIIGARLGLSLPNPAPDVEPENYPTPTVPMQTNITAHAPEDIGPNEPKRKKYAKEAWPGRKPGLIPPI